MGTLKAFAHRINTIADELDERAHQDAIDATLVMVGSLVYDTPVDESTALSNWQVTVGVPAQASQPAYYLGLQGSTQRQSAQAALDAAKAVLATKKPGQPIYISNLLPYIRPLNSGHSGQHPGGFVEIAVMRGRNYLRKLRGGRK